MCLCVNHRRETLAAKVAIAVLLMWWMPRLLLPKRLKLILLSEANLLTTKHLKFSKRYLLTNTNGLGLAKLTTQLIFRPFPTLNGWISDRNRILTNWLDQENETAQEATSLLSDAAGTKQTFKMRQKSRWMKLNQVLIQPGTNKENVIV